MTVSLEDDGPNLVELEVAFKDGAKCFYAVPNFQNPSGVSYSLEKRQAVAALLDKYDVLFIEDDPYGELRFMGEDMPSVCSFCKTPSILCGSFSKIAAPGFRIGWVVTEKEIYDKLVIAKQASDLHTSTVAQAIMRRYLETNDIEAHVGLIKDRYGRQRECMVEMIKKYFPGEVTITEPEGGMFLWATLPEGRHPWISLMSLSRIRSPLFPAGRSMWMVLARIHSVSTSPIRMKRRLRKVSSDWATAIKSLLK